LSPAADVSDISAILAAARPSETTVLLCLRGDLVAEHEQLATELAEVVKTDPGEEASLAGSTTGVLAARIRDLESQIREDRVEFRFRALPRARFVALKAKHTRGDDDLELNPFFTELLAASLTSPAATVDEVQRLANTVSAGQWDQLTGAAWRVNTGGVDVPFSRTASVILRTEDSSTN
jgi:hypothetical protein